LRWGLTVTTGSLLALGFLACRLEPAHQRTSFSDRPLQRPRTSTSLLLLDYSPWDLGRIFLSERVSGADACGLARRWLLDPDLAARLVELEDLAARVYATERFRWPGLYIISGYRTRFEQARVNTFQEVSHHRCCPALAVDLRVGDFPASSTPVSIWEELGSFWQALGGKWGGDFEIPDLNHFYQAGEKCWKFF